MMARQKDGGNRKGTGSQGFPLLPRVLFRPFVVKGTRLTVELVDRTEWKASFDHVFHVLRRSGGPRHLPDELKGTRTIKPNGRDSGNRRSGSESDLSCVRWTKVIGFIIAIFDFSSTLSRSKYKSVYIFN